MGRSLLVSRALGAVVISTIDLFVTVDGPGTSRILSTVVEEGGTNVASSVQLPRAKVLNEVADK